MRLGSPSPNPCGSNCNSFSDPFQWWDAWQSSCNKLYGRDCRADFYASHFYTCDPSAFAGRALTHLCMCEPHALGWQPGCAQQSCRA